MMQLPNSSKQMAWLGFSGGVILTYCYATMFFLYAAIRLASSAISSAEPSHAAGTLFLLGMSLLLTVLVFAALMALVAGAIGVTTALIAYWLKRWLPIPMTLIGTSFAITGLVNLSVIVGTGSDLFGTQLQTYLFWLAVPSLIYLMYSVYVGKILSQSVE